MQAEVTGEGSCLIALLITIITPEFCIQTQHVFELDLYQGLLGVWSSKSDVAGENSPPDLQAGQWQDNICLMSLVIIWMAYALCPVHLVAEDIRDGAIGSPAK